MADELFNPEPFEQIRGQLPLDTDALDPSESCLHCGRAWLEHRWDGACPTCDDDAAYYREHDH